MSLLHRAREWGSYSGRAYIKMCFYVYHDRDTSSKNMIKAFTLNLDFDKRFTDKYSFPTTKGATMEAFGLHMRGGDKQYWKRCYDGVL